MQNVLRRVQASCNRIRRFQDRANQLYAKLQLEGPTEDLVREYNILDTEVQEHLIEVAGARVKKKYGYSRSPELGHAGLNLNFWKMILSSKQLGRELSKKSKKTAERLDIDIEEVQELSKEGARKAVRIAREQLQEVQYQASQHRQAWLERNAQNVARAVDEPDWQKHMQRMLKDERDREVNRKLTGIVKGQFQSLDWIEVPTGEWYYSHVKKEVYRYDKGVFESYAAWSPSPSLIPSHPVKFYQHHHLKVPHDDIVEAMVEDDGERYVLKAIYRPHQVWRTVTDTKEIEMLLLERNERHLQQASIEEGRCQSDIIQQIQQGHGTDLLSEVLDGTLQMDDATDEVIRAWVSTLKQTDKERALPKITGKITKNEFHKLHLKK
jgi:hypothetical protein